MKFLYSFIIKYNSKYLHNHEIYNIESKLRYLLGYYKIFHY